MYMMTSYDITVMSLMTSHTSSSKCANVNKYFELKKLVGLPPQLEILAPFGRCSVTHDW